MSWLTYYKLKQRWFYCTRGKHANKLSNRDNEGGRGACLWCKKGIKQ